MTEAEVTARWLPLMTAALRQAEAAARLGEVPIGAVVAVDGTVVGQAHNRTIVDRDPTAHAEVLALRQACGAVGNHRLLGAVLVTTLEPCIMCCGAAVQSRVRMIVHGADDPKAGALDVLRDLMARGRVNHHVDLERGPLAEDSARLLRSFFRDRR